MNALPTWFVAILMALTVGGISLWSYLAWPYRCPRCQRRVTLSQEHLVYSCAECGWVEDTPLNNAGCK